MKLYLAYAVVFALIGLALWQIGKYIYRSDQAYSANYCVTVYHEDAQCRPIAEANR